MTRCPHCGRRQATERQNQHWLAWCWKRHDRFDICGNRKPWRYRVKRYRYHTYPWVRIYRWQPLWFRYSTRCMGGYDCTPEWYPHNPIPANWYVRRCYRKVTAA